MKKQIISVLSILLVVFLSACGSISTHDYNAVLAERDELLIQKENLEKEYTAVCEERDALLANASESTKLITATISGHFTALVRSTLPDYCFDDTTCVRHWPAATKAQSQRPRGTAPAATLRS